MDELLINYIDEIVRNKIESGIVPSHVTYVELNKLLHNEFKESLNRLFKNNQIEVGHTINDKWIKIKKECKNGNGK